MSNDDGDPAYWLREHGPRLLAFARQYVRCRADAEDVIQQAFIRFWQSGRGAREPLAYLYSCVRNAAINWTRSEGRRGRHENAVPARPPWPAPEAPLEQEQRRRRIDSAMAELDEDQRAVVALKVWGDLTFDQIGKVLSISRSTAHWMYRNAMNSLHSRLEQEMQP